MRRDLELAIAPGFTQIVEDPWGMKCEDVEILGHGEDHMKIRHREKLRRASIWLAKLDGAGEAVYRPSQRAAFTCQRH